VGSEVAIPRVPPDAVQVITSLATDGRPVATHWITDARTVADLYTRINRLPSAAWTPFHCQLGLTGQLTVSLRFVRWGLPVEVATLPQDGCWRVSHGGLADPFLRIDPHGETPTILNEALPPRP
jgi:hypothetical protein